MAKLKRQPPRPQHSFSSKRSTQVPLAETITQIKSALADWEKSAVNPFSTQTQSAEPPKTDGSREDTLSIMKKTRKLLLSLNRQMEELSD